MIDLLSRRRAMMMGGEILPYDAQVEWMSNGGAAYIDTGIIPVDTPRIVFSVAPTGYMDTDLFGFSVNQVPAFVGDLARTSNTPLSFQYYRYYNTSAVGHALDVNDIALNEFAEWDLGYICKCNGQILTTLTRQSFAANTQNIFLFKGRTTCSGNARLAYAKIYDGDTLMRDFIPVRVGTTGYMYDRVSGQLFDNVGSGSFILGNDK